MKTTLKTLSEPSDRRAPARCSRRVGKRIDAKPIKRILDRKTRKVVGWLYEWNTGELLPMWKSEVYKDFIYE